MTPRPLESAEKSEKKVVRARPTRALRRFRRVLLSFDAGGVQERGMRKVWKAYQAVMKCIENSQETGMPG